MPRNILCSNCPLCLKAKNRCVWGQGAVRPLAFFIGEAPGEKEDLHAFPFHPTGAAGKLLRGLIHEMELDDACYISNVVKCRPPENRKPSAPEAEACYPYLVEELEATRPEFIVALGATAIEALCGVKHAAIGNYRWRRDLYYQGKGWKAPIIATYHPAAVKRDPSRMPDLIDDLNRIGSKEFTKEEEVQWSLRPYRILKPLPKKVPTPFAFDLETSSLSPFSRLGEETLPRILCAAWSGKERMASVTKEASALVELLSRKPCEWIGHNIKFDLLWLRSHTGIQDALTCPPRLHDTMVLSHLLNENRTSHGLDSLVLEHTGLGAYWQDIEPYQKKMADAPEEILHAYNAYDAAATFMIWKKLLPEVRKEGLEHAYETKMRQVPALIEMEYRGIQVDKERLDELSHTLDRSANLCLSRLRKVIPTLNPGSTQQLRDAIFTELGYSSWKVTPKGALSTDEETLTELLHTPYHGEKLTPRQARAFIQTLLDWRANRKQVDVWLEGPKGVRACMDVAGRVHPSYHVTGTVTGRLSCSHPNLQNVPRDSSSPIKSIFVAPPGRVLIQADYSQIELRMMAWHCRDKTMLELLRTGADLHTQTARLLAGHEPSKEERAVAKIVNFATLYGAGPKTIAKHTDMSEKQASEYIRRWYALYPGVLAWQKQMEGELLRRGEIRSIFGRKRHLPGAVPSNKRVYLHQMRQACNFPIQSSAAELTLMAMALLYERLPLGCYLVCNVHDSLLVEAPERKTGIVTRLMQNTMEDATGICKEFGYNTVIDVPTPVEISSGPSWGVQ